MSEVVIRQFCPASQVQAHLTLLLTSKPRGVIVAGKPVHCDLQDNCGYRTSARCLLVATKLTDKKVMEN